jgi:Flp pilus assembly protein TadD
MRQAKYGSAALMTIFLFACSGQETETEVEVIETQKVAQEAPEVTEKMASLEPSLKTKTIEAPNTLVQAAPPPESSPPQITYGEAMAEAKRQLANGNWEDAVQSYEFAAKLKPLKAKPLIAAARLLLRHGKANKARPLVEKAVDLAPWWSSAWNTLGRVELVEGNLTQAGEAFTAATLKNPKNIYAHNNLGLVRLKEGRYEDAVASLLIATADKKAKPYMHNNLGSALEKLGKLEKARNAYKEALAFGSSLAGKNFARVDRQITTP